MRVRNASLEILGEGCFLTRTSYPDWSLLVIDQLSLRNTRRSAHKWSKLRNALDPECLKSNTADSDSRHLAVDLMMSGIESYEKLCDAVTQLPMRLPASADGRHALHKHFAATVVAFRLQECLTIKSC